MTCRVVRRAWGVGMGSLAARLLARAAPEHPVCAVWPTQHARATECRRGANGRRPQPRPLVQAAPERPTSPEHPVAEVGPMRLRQPDLSQTLANSPSLADNPVCCCIGLKTGQTRTRCECGSVKMEQSKSAKKVPAAVSSGAALLPHLPPPPEPRHHLVQGAQCHRASAAETVGTAQITRSICQGRAAA